MKRITPFITLTLLMSLGVPLNKINPVVIKAAGSCTYSTSLPTVIDLNDSTNQEIRDYYSSLNSLSEDELKGENLLTSI